MQTNTGDKRREGSVHGSRERVPGALFRAMAKLFLLKNPNSYREALALNLQARLAKCGVRYHHGTLRRQFGGAISSVPPEVETVMREILLETHGLETVADIERALASSRLQVPPDKRLPLYISSDTVLRLAQLWLHLNPGKSKRFLACCLRQDLGREGVRQDLNSLQRILAGKQDLARQEVREKLLVYLARHGVGSEAEALTLLQSQAQEIRRTLEDRGFVSPRRFSQLCRLWQLRHREASSRRLAVLLQQKMSEWRVSINLHHLQALVDGKTRRGRRGILAALEELLREEFPGPQNLEEEIAEVSPQSPRMVDLTWVQAEPIATLARRWISQHGAFSRRQLAIRVSRTIRGMGYSCSHNTIQSILGGWKKRTRGFVYRAMLKQFDGGDRAQIPKQHIVKLGWTSESMAADMRAKTKVKRSSLGTVKSIVQPAWESVNPNLLKAVVLKTLNGMEREERDLFYERLLGALDRVAINVGLYLMMLGIPASTPHEVTPLEWGHLIRYFRVNVPRAMRAVADVLDEFPAFTHRTAEDCRLDLG